MGNEVQEAKQLLDLVDSNLPWRFDEVNQPEKWIGSDTKFGAIRTKGGFNVVQPFEGSSSIMMGRPIDVELIVKAPALLKALMESLTSLQSEIDKKDAKIEILTEMLKARDSSDTASKEPKIT